MAALFGFDEEGVKRIRATVETVEGWPKDERDQRRAVLRPKDPVTQWIKCTDAVADANGRYPAVWCSYDEETDTWTDQAECYLRRGANQEVPSEGEIYRAWCQGVAPDGSPVYVPIIPATQLVETLYNGSAESIPAGPGSAFPFDGVYDVAANEVLETGTFFDIANPTRILTPYAGRYSVSAVVEWSSGLGTKRIFQLWLYTNAGASKYRFATDQRSNFASAVFRTAHSIEMYNNVDDGYMQLEIGHDHTANLNVEVKNFSIRYLGGL
jgi:hypothetical protein